jgi:DNA-binding GntR family transcriptional regulator
MNFTRNSVLEREPARLPDVLGLELSAIIERRIIYLQLAPGSHITEQELCDEFNVSRSPVREAFRQLEASGLIVRHARRGVRVTPMTEEDLNEIYFCRIPLEALAASCAAKNRQDDDLLFLKARLDAMEQALVKADGEAFFGDNVAFINRVHQVTGNRMLSSLLSIVEKHAMRYRYFAHTHSRTMLQNSAEGLHGLYESIRDRKSAQSKQRMLALMRKAHQLIAGVLRDHPSLSVPEN